MKVSTNLLIFFITLTAFVAGRLNHRNHADSLISKNENHDLPFKAAQFFESEKLETTTNKELLRLGNFQKHSITMKKSDTVHRQQSDTHNLPLLNNQDNSYLIDLLIGSTQQAFQVLIDTGSSDLWVPDVQNRDNIQSYPRFDCEQSTTCVNSQVHSGLTYDDGPISGLIYFDNIVFGGQLLIKNQSFISIQSASGAMKQAPGIIGLGPKRLAANSENPYFLENLKNSQQIEKMIFSVYLGTNSGQYDSMLILGGIDLQFVKKGEPIIYSEIVSEYSYRIRVDGFVMRNGDVIRFNEALIDSGTSCITLPSQLASKLLDNFSNSNLECSWSQEQYSPEYSLLRCVGFEQDFPNFNIQIKDKEILEIYPADYFYACRPVDGGKVDCITQLESSDQDDVVIFGDAFFQSIYVVFDLQAHRIGLAHSINKHETLMLESFNENVPIVIDSKETAIEEKRKVDKTFDRVVNISLFVGLASIMIITFFFSQCYKPLRKQEQGKFDPAIITTA